VGASGNSERVPALSLYSVERCFTFLSMSGALDARTAGVDSSRSIHPGVSAAHDAA
jgi:hypothetical protein